MSSYQDFLNQPKSKNIVHNGDFQIWQRGSSFAAHTGGKTADRWGFGETAATCVCSVDRDASNIPHANTLQSYKVTATTGQASFTGGEYAHIVQNIEGYYFHAIANKQVTFSFWVYATVPGTYSCFFRSSNYDYSLIKEFTINNAETWEYKKVTFFWDTSVGTYTYNNTHAANVGFAPACGTTYATSTIGEWVSGNYIASTNQTNFAASTNNVFNIAQVQLEVGRIATDFDYMHRGDGIKQCLRYYEVLNITYAVATSVGTGNGNYYCMQPQYPKRTSASGSSVGSAQMWSPANGWRSATSTASTVYSAYWSIYIFQDTGATGYVAGNGGLIQAVAYLSADL